VSAGVFFPEADLKRAFLAALSAATAATVLTTAPARAALSPDDKALVDKAAAYLQGLDEDKGRFTQTDPHGVVSQGELYLKRPGKIRFEYDPPSSLRVVSDGKRVTVEDPRLKTVNSYPLNATPLSVFLADHIRLDKGVVVDQVIRTSYGFEIVAHQGKLRDGTLAMVFSTSPMRLMEWTVQDAQGGRTRVQVSDFGPTHGLADSLFRAGGAAQPSDLRIPPVAAR
jgi:outer membrane lipoprotein-sorting protein